MDRKIVVVWIAILGISLVESLVGLLPMYIGALLPIFFLSLSFYVFRKIPLGYRIFHLIFVAQFMLYVIFITLLNYGSLFKEGWRSSLAYSQFTPTIFIYIAFLALFGLVYFPYFLLKRRKRKPY